MNGRLFYKASVLALAGVLGGCSVRDDAGGVRLCADWSVQQSPLRLPFHAAAISNNFTVLHAETVLTPERVPVFSFRNEKFSKTVPCNDWFDRAYALELLVRLPAASNEFFAGTWRSTGVQDGRGFFVALNALCKGKYSGSIRGAVQRGPLHTLAPVQTCDGFLRSQEWQHIVMTKSPRHVRLYVNGCLVSSHKMVMQYSYVYPLKDFTPRRFQVEGSADVAFLRLYDGWLDRPQVRGLYRAAAGEFKALRLPQRQGSFFASRVLCAGVALAVLCGILVMLPKGLSWIARRTAHPAVVGLLARVKKLQCAPAVVSRNAKMHIALLAALIVVLAVREHGKLGQPTYEYRNDVLWGDYLNTDVAARDVAAGFGFREMRLQESPFPRNPLQCLNLGMCYTLFGSGAQDERVHRVAGSVTFVLGCVFLFELLAWVFGAAPAFLGLLAFSGVGGIATQTVLAESAATLCLALFGYCTTTCVRRKSRRWAALAGVVAGASVLVRSYFAVVWLAAAGWFLWRALWDAGHARRWLAIGGVFTACCAAPLLLYGTRNLISCGKFTVGSTYQQVDPWGQYCGDTPIDFHAWQLFKWPADVTAQTMMQQELRGFLRDFPQEFITTALGGMKWICVTNMPARLRAVLPFAVPLLLVFCLACVVVNTGGAARLRAEAAVFFVLALVLTLLALGVGHPSGFPETVPRYWFPLAVCLGALAVAAVVWLPGCGWLRGDDPDGVDTVVRHTVPVLLGTYAVLLTLCMLIWSVRYHLADFPMPREFDWTGFARGVLACEGRLPSNVVASATGTLGYAARTSYGLQADLLVRNSAYPRGETRVRLKMAHEFVPLAGLDPATVWGKQVRVRGTIIPYESNNVFEAFCLDVEKMQLVDDLFCQSPAAEKLAVDTNATSQTRPAHYLMDMEPSAIVGLLKGLVLGSTYDREPVIINKMYYPKSIAMHPLPDGPSYVEYTLNGAYRTFSSVVSMTAIGNAKFMVYGDGKLLYETPYLQLTNLHICPLPMTNTPMQIDVAIGGVTTLRLAIDKGYHNYSDHAVWADPKLLP